MLHHLTIRKPTFVSALNQCGLIIRRNLVLGEAILAIRVSGSKLIPYKEKLFNINKRLRTGVGKSSFMSWN